MLVTAQGASVRGLDALEQAGVDGVEHVRVVDRSSCVESSNCSIVAVEDVEAAISALPPPSARSTARPVLDADQDAVGDRLHRRGTLMRNE